MSQRARRATRHTGVSETGSISHCPNLLRGSTKPQRSHSREMGVTMGGFTLLRYQILVCPLPPTSGVAPLLSKRSYSNNTPGKLAALQDYSPRLNRPKQVTPKGGPDSKPNPGQICRKDKRKTLCTWDCKILKHFASAMDEAHHPGIQGCSSQQRETEHRIC